MPFHGEQLERETYEVLTSMARQMLVESGTLATLDVVHSAWLKLAPHTFTGEAEFKVVASHAMRQVLADYARAKSAQKRRPGHLTFSDGVIAVVPLVDLHRALEELHAADLRSYEVTVLRYLGGMTVKEVADHLEVSERTVKNVWRLTRAWLADRLS
jgi:RNA polymerase sigma factor (TIGR02999 family)